MIVVGYSGQGARTQTGLVVSTSEYVWSARRVSVSASAPAWRSQVPVTSRTGSGGTQEGSPSGHAAMGSCALVVGSSGGAAEHAVMERAATAILMANRVLTWT